LKITEQSLEQAGQLSALLRVEAADQLGLTTEHRVHRSLDQCVPGLGEGDVLTTDAFRDRLTPGSSVISTGSIGAERRGGSYGAAKAALQAWNGFLSAELGPRGVTANVVSCGYLADTEFFQGRMTPERHAALVAETHDGRPGTPFDVAETVFFLASPGARHLTGQTLHVNGGAFTTR
jgi:3-oxoacyl-[acyl-carrier protein] reductase